MPPDAEPIDPKALRLLNQIRWVSRLSVALGSTQGVDDVYSVLLSGLLSPTGLGYSSVLVLDCDTFGGQFRGRAAMGFENPEAIRLLAEELLAEESFLGGQAEKFSNTLAENPEHESAIYNLRVGAQWITTYNKLSSDAEGPCQFATLSFPIDKTKGPTSEKDLLSRAFHWRTPRNLRLSEIKGSLPDEIASRLPEDFVVVPVFTSEELLGIFFVDRRHGESTEFTADDIEELEFFSNQGALAVSNAKMIGDLNRAYQAMKEIDILKSNFLSTISHELRTPLTAMIGFVDLVAGEKVGTLNGTQLTLMSRVQTNVRHMITMVNDLIEVAELQTQGPKGHALLPIDPLEVLLKAQEMLDHRRRDKRCEIIPELPMDGLPKVLAHEESLRRIFFHILDNASKFSPSLNPVHVIFDVRERTIAISIKDHGIGIPKEKVAKIFEQFYQVDNSMTRSQEGLGIGLNITRMLAQSLKAQLSVESELGIGSTFTIELQRADR